MPYIKPEQRLPYDEVLGMLPTIQNKGELEYVLFSIMKDYMDSREPNYATIHDTVYAATHTADEFRRRYLNPREDSAIAKNGDIL